MSTEYLPTEYRPAVNRYISGLATNSQLIYWPMYHSRQPTVNMIPDTFRRVRIQGIGVSITQSLHVRHTTHLVYKTVSQFISLQITCNRNLQASHFLVAGLTVCFFEYQ